MESKQEEPIVVALWENFLTMVVIHYLQVLYYVLQRDNGSGIIYTVEDVKNIKMKSFSAVKIWSCTTLSDL